MRVLLVNKFHYRKGGAETYYLEVGAALEQMGHDVAYFSMNHPNNLPCAQERYFVTQREYNDVRNPLKAIADGISLVYSLEARRKFQALCEEFHPDVVHLNNVHRQITLSILDAPYLADHNVPVIYTAHDYVTVCPGYLMLDGMGHVCDRCLEDGNYHHCAENRCIKGSYAKSMLAVIEASFNRAKGMNKKIDRVIAPSHFMAKKLIEGGWASDKVAVLQNFVSDAILNQARLGGSDRTEWKSPYLLFFGRISKEKGVDTLIDAFLIAEQLLPGWRLVVAGDGPQLDSLRRKLSSAETSSNVELVGYLSGKTLHSLIERASIAIVPSRCRENMPFSVVEAFAAGTPVIASRIGGIPEIVSEGDTGFLAEPGKVYSLVQAIMRAVDCCRDRGSYRAMQARCRNYITKNCNQRRFTERMIDIYRREINVKKAQ